MVCLHDSGIVVSESVRKGRCTKIGSSQPDKRAPQPPALKVSPQEADSHHDGEEGVGHWYGKGAQGTAGEGM